MTRKVKGKGKLGFV